MGVALLLWVEQWIQFFEVCFYLHNSYEDENRGVIKSVICKCEIGTDENTITFFEVKNAVLQVVLPL
ncbi:MAG: hypothetical protein IKK92_10405 [Prevotella sp.]|nr:hypothetical protein [Prevotella sp.]